MSHPRPRVPLQPAAECGQQRQEIREQRARDSGGGVTAAGGRGLRADTVFFYRPLFYYWVKIKFHNYYFSFEWSSFITTSIV